MVCKEFSSYKPWKDKISELVVVGSTQLIKRLPHISLFLLGKTISPVSFANQKILGFILISIYIYVHITKTASSCMNQEVQISRIQHLLDKKTL